MERRLPRERDSMTASLGAPVLRQAMRWLLRKTQTPAKKRARTMASAPSARMAETPTSGRSVWRLSVLVVPAKLVEAVRRKAEVRRPKAERGPKPEARTREAFGVHRIPALSALGH